MDNIYRSKRILVTGASGFIGMHLCDRLFELAAEVVGVFLNHRPDMSNIKWRQCDLTDAQAVNQLIFETRPDYVFHLAGYVEGSRDLSAVQPSLMTNLVATVNLMQACQQVQCVKRIVLTNSQEEPQSRGDLPIPSSPYAAAKFSASAYARMFHALYDLPVVIARVFMVYGPGQLNTNKLVPYTILQTLEGEPPLISSGSRMIDWVYVEDVVDALLAMGTSDNCDGETIDIGSGIFTSIADVVNTIVTGINPGIKAQFGALSDRVMEQEHLANTDETAFKIHWRAKTDLASGLTNTIAWYRDNYVAHSEG